MDCNSITIDVLSYGAIHLAFFAAGVRKHVLEFMKYQQRCSIESQICVFQEVSFIHRNMDYYCMFSLDWAVSTRIHFKPD